MVSRVNAGLRRVALLGVVAVLIGFPGTVSADNQVIMKNIGTSDPAPMVGEDGRFYFYVTEDAVGGGNLAINTIACYSTDDMYHWSERNEVLNEKDISWCNQNNELWAPHCVYLGGKYHLYFPETAGSNFRLGHATCDTPDGKFIADNTYMGAVTGNALDPCVVVDSTSGTAWLVWNIVWITPNNTYIQALNSSYDDVTGTRYELTNQMGQSAATYKEAPWMFKRGSTYYFYYADWTGPERAGLSTSSTMTSGFSFQRYVLGTNSNCATLHPGVMRYKGNDYLFWHCDGTEFGGSITTGDKRVVGIEWHTLGEVTDKTMRGVGIPGADDTIQVDRQSAMNNVSISILQGESGVGYMVSSIRDNGWVRYDSVDFTNCGGVRARVANTNTNNEIEIRVGSNNGTLLGTITDIPSTGGLTTWQTTDYVPLTQTTTGIQNLCLVFSMGSQNSMNVNWIQFDIAGNVRPTEAITNSPGFSCTRLSRNLFKLNIPAGAAVAEIRLFNLRGQEAAKVKQSRAPDGKSVNMSFNKALSSGTYVLRVKSSSGSFEHPFIY